MEIKENIKFPLLGDIVKITSGNSSLTKKIYKPDGKYTAFSATGPDGKVDFYAEEGDAIILSAVGARCGKCFRASGQWTTIANTGIIRIKDEKIASYDYLFYLLNDENFWPKGGSSQPFVQVGKAQKEIKISLPPLKEQQKIVAKLDAIMERVNANKQRLDNIPKILKRFKQSVLAAAVSGRLTGEWRKKNKTKEEWGNLNLADVIIDKPKNGYSAKPVNYETNLRVITLTATTSGKFIDKHFKYFDEEISSDSNFWLQPNDILVQRGNALEYVGVSAIYDGKPNEFIYPDLMMRLRVNNKILTQYLYYVLSDEKSRNYLRERATGTSGNMPKINQPTLMSLPIQLPELKEQQEIIKRVNELFAFADKIEVRYTKTKQQLDKLPQSILAKAFRGELL